MVVFDVSRVREGKSVNYETDPFFDEECRLRVFSDGDLSRQYASVSRICEVLGVFTRIPVALDVMVGSDNGKIISEGTITPFTVKTFVISRNIWSGLHFSAWKFSRLYPESLFIFLLTQAVKVEYLMEEGK